MDVQRRDELYAEIVELEKVGNWEGVADACCRIADLNLPDLEKGVALGNAATAYGHLKNLDRALSYFDKAIRLESKHNRYRALEQKAAFLAEQKRSSESLLIYRTLIGRADLYVADIQRYAHNIEILEQEVRSQNG